MSFLIRVNTCRFLWQKWIVICFIMHVITLSSLAKPDTETIAVALIIHPTIKAFTQTSTAVIALPEKRAGYVGDDLSKIQLCFSQQGLTGFDVFMGKQLNKTLIRSSMMANKGCYLPFSQISKKEYKKALERVNQTITLTVSPL